MKYFDVVIAGRGPGGLAAAESATRAGCSVLIMEQDREIGSPTRTTGGSFVQDLRALGIPEHLYHPIKRCRFVSPHNTAVFTYEDPVTCVMDVRAVFQFLAEKAAEAGTRIAVGTTVLYPIVRDDIVCGVKARGPTNREVTVNCKILIDATGYKASMVKQSGVHSGYKRFGIGSEYDLYAPACDQQEAVLIVGSQVAPAGYAWVFPWGRNRVRIGIGILHNDSNVHPAQYLDSLVERADVFGVNLEGALEYHFGVIPSERLAQPFVGNGIMAVGDAAGQPSALVGEGIRGPLKRGGWREM